LAFKYFAKNVLRLEQIIQVHCRLQHIIKRRILSTLWGSSSCWTCL